MKPLSNAIMAAALALFLCTRSAHAAPPEADIARFITAKSNQVYLATRDGGAPVPPEVWKLFTAASAGDWKSATDLLRSVTVNYHVDASHRLRPDVWFRVQDVGGFCELLSSNDQKFVRLFADEVFKVIPPGSIYFGGTDPGRFVITALSRSHEEGQPFFTLTQNQLVDSDYLTYLHAIYRQQVKLPDQAMVKTAFDDYYVDAKRRFDHDQQFPDEPKQVLPGEEIKTVNGQVQISGQVAVMAINGRLVHDILNLNPGREFYIEESFPLDWMYPYLEPTGLIFKVHRSPLDSLFEETVLNDREFWQRLTRRLIGHVLHDETDVAELCATAQELNGKPKDFQGDPDFLRDESARKTFSKLRSAGSGLYAWRAVHAKSSSERRTMTRAAELAFKQAFLLCPQSPEAVGRYVVYLISAHRSEDAQKIVSLSLKLSPDDDILKSWARYTQQMSDWQKSQQ